MLMDLARKITNLDCLFLQGLSSLYPQEFFSAVHLHPHLVTTVHSGISSWPIPSKVEEEATADRKGKQNVPLLRLLPCKFLRIALVALQKPTSAPTRSTAEQGALNGRKE